MSYFFILWKNIIAKFLFNKTDIILILLFIFLAFFIRVTAISSLHGYSLCSDIINPSYTFCSDDALYMSMARYIVQGDFLKALHPIWPPLYPMISAVAYLIFHNWTIGGRVVSILAGSFLIIPLYLFCLSYFSRNIAMIVSIILSLFSPLVFASVQPLSESLLIFTFWMGITFLLFAWKKINIWNAFFSGIFFGLASLTRVEGIFAFVGFLLFFLASVFFQKLRGKNYLYLFICVVVGFSILYMPYQMAMSRKFGKPLLFGKASALFNLSNHFNLSSDGKSTWAQDVDSIETVNPQSEVYSGFQKIIATRYMSMITDTLTRTKIEFKTIASYLTFFDEFFLLIGVITLYTVAKKRIEMLAIFIIFLITLSGSMFFAPDAEERYIYWFLPIVPLLLALGLVAIINIIISQVGIPKKFIASIYFFTIFIIVFGQLTVSYNSLKKITQVTQKQYIYPEDNWLLKNGPKKGVMMHHEGYGFYSQSFIVYTPNVNNLMELLKYAHLWNVSYIIPKRGEIPDQLIFLINDPKDYPGLKLIRDKNVLMYKVI